MREYYLPDKWIELAKETMKSTGNKEELEHFLRSTNREKEEAKECN